MQAPLLSPAPTDCHLFLIRHGSTANNLANPPKVQGRKSNDSLSEQGRREADATAQFLEQQQFAAVFASPLKRAQETAQVVAAPHGLEVQTIEAIIEADVGDWEGFSWEEIRKREPEAFARYSRDASIYPYRGGETVSQVVARVEPVFLDLMQRHTGQNIAVVAHNVVNRSYLARVLNVPLSYARHVYQDNCGVSVIRCREGTPKVLSLNEAVHVWEIKRTAALKR